MKITGKAWSFRFLILGFVLLSVVLYVSLDTFKPAQLTLQENPAEVPLVRDLYEAGYDIANDDLCSALGASLQFLILITSAPDHTEARRAIRQTWGRYAKSNNIALSFVLGRTKAPSTSTVKSEFETHRDIIVSKCVDSYENLTLKAASMLEWANTYCPSVKFVLKTDDDMFINVPRLINFVATRKNHTRTIFGRLVQSWRPVRNPESQYYLSPQMWAPEFLPDFMTGPAYLLTGDIVPDLYVNALETPYLKLEDVFLTGIIAEKIGVKKVAEPEFSNQYTIRIFCDVKNHISIHIEPSSQYDLWERLFVDKQCLIFLLTSCVRRFQECWIFRMFLCGLFVCLWYCIKTFLRHFNKRNPFR